MLAERNSAVGRQFMKLHRFCFGIFVLFTLDLKVYYIARYYVWYKNYQVIYFCDGFSFGSHIRNCHLLQ